MEAFRELFHQYAPRWIKAIRWQDARERFVEGQLKYLHCLYIPGAAVWLFCQQNPYATQLVLHRPETEEERAELRRNYNTNRYQRNWKLDEYPTKQRPPLYDLSERRAKYPQYYGDRYSGTLKEGYFFKKTDYIDRIPRRALVEKKEV